MEKQSRNEPLEELTEMLKALQEKEKIQNCIVRKFQILIQNEGVFSSVIGNFSYPMEIFEQDGEIVSVNSVLSEETELQATDLSKSKQSLLNRITDANLQILDAVENVFLGKTTFLSGLSNPLEIFMSERTERKLSSYKYLEAVFSPLPKTRTKPPREQ